MTLSCEIYEDDQAHDVGHQATNGSQCLESVDEKVLLEMVASGRKTSEILDAVSRSAEEIGEGARCGIYLIDWTGPRIRSFSAPGLPVAFSLSLTGLPLRLDTGPCARAAWLRAPVIVADLESDARWQGSAFAALAATHGLRSWWSTPICAAGEVLGTLAVLRPRPASPSQAQKDLIDRLTYIASIAIKLMLVNAELNRTSAKLAHAMEVAALGASIADKVIEPLSGVVINASTGRRMLTACTPNVAGARETIRRTLRDCNRAAELISRLRSTLGSKGDKPYASSGRLDWA